MPLRFEHGEFAIEPITHHLISCEMSGTFNKEGMKAWVNGMKSMIEPIKNEPFGLLIDARGYTGGTGEALEIAEGFHQWLRHTKLVAQGHVISSPTLYSISLSRIPSLKHHVVKDFLRMDEAHAWITDKLAS
ncbi:hypothetical protein CF138_16745 [Aeromonas hydrophila]|nr:hypothetical protein C7K70_11675 [Aeromonas hydrophila]TNH83317.1 hypothetical protein CF138_16745 [Aeromonas hydrophila]TNI04602.1 hypothetical protein CF136_01980 [Aeromonas hydrophila]TNI99923.1 hypothetical protein CF118_02860 [Aeromonas hydrophila]GKQ97711.1 hypothetical protein KAM461_19610 [Aeromonas hydrophila]